LRQGRCCDRSRCRRGFVCDGCAEWVAEVAQHDLDDGSFDVTCMLSLVSLVLKPHIPRKDRVSRHLVHDRQRGSLESCGVCSLAVSAAASTVVSSSASATPLAAGYFSKRCVQSFISAIIPYLRLSQCGRPCGRLGRSRLCAFFSFPPSLLVGHICHHCWSRHDPSRPSPSDGVKPEYAAYIPLLA